MPQARSKPTDSWAQLIREELVSGTHGRPEGEEWRTSEEFADENGLSRQRAFGILQAMHRKGKLEMQRGKVGKHWTNYYRPVVKQTPSRLIKPILSKGSLSK